MAPFMLPKCKSVEIESGKNLFLIAESHLSTRRSMSVDIARTKLIQVRVAFCNSGGTTVRRRCCFWRHTGSARTRQRCLTERMYHQGWMRLFEVCVLIFGAVAAGAEWPQWGGPARDFRLPRGVQVPLWPATGPKQVWARDLGEGYSSMLMSANALYTMYRRGSQDVVIALDPATGKTVWETGIDAPHRSGMNWRLVQGHTRHR